MNNQVAKAIGKKVVANIFILAIILFLVVVITGIPIDFDIVTRNGQPAANMDISQIRASIRGNFQIFTSGEAFNIVIEGTRTGELLFETGKRSLLILFFGSLLAIVIGIPKGIIDSRKSSNSGTFKLLQSLVPLSLPDVFTISLVQLFAIYAFNNNINILGLGTIPFVGDETLLYAVYPIISISILPAAYISRIVASTIEEEFTKPYILAARGKGCSRVGIIKTHMMKSIGFSVLSGLPTILGIMFSSLIIVERMFFYKGIGYYLLYFYTSPLLDSYEAGVGFTLFVVALAVFYFLIFMIINGLKNILLPKEK